MQGARRRPGERPQRGGPLALEGPDVLEIPWPTIVTVFVRSGFVGLAVFVGLGAALIPAFGRGG